MKLLMTSTQSLTTSIEGLFPETENLVFHEAQTRMEEGVQHSYSSVGRARSFTGSPLPVLWTAQGSRGEVSLSRNLACDAVSSGESQ